MTTIFLREVAETDLPVFFAQQCDATANHMAAFTPPAPHDHDAFLARWTRHLADATTRIQTIVCEGEVAGHVSCYEHEGKTEVTYWLGKEYWGRGIATQALRTFVQSVPARPLYARAAKDNVASLRVLAKCGFVIYGEDAGFSAARGVDVEEFLLVLQTTVPTA